MISVNYERILAPLKDADGDEIVIKHATELARLSGGTVILSHVAHTHTRDSAAYLEEQARSWLEHHAETLRGQGIPVEVMVVEGEPAEGICQAAERTGASLIVMGSHRHGQVRHLLLGSVTEAVIRNCSTSVMVVRP